MKFLILIFSFVICVQTFGQAKMQEFTLRTLVYDSLNKQVIPFASLYKKRDLKGTISNHAGEIVLENVRENDTLICSYIGFEKKQFTAVDLLIVDTLFLQKKVHLIDEVTVLADNSILYALINRSGNQKEVASKTAKTYFELSSYHNNSQLEFFQGYYNGNVKGYDVEQLELKNARFALSPINHRLFASTETSKAMYMQRTFKVNNYFPSSPFEFSPKQLRKKYDLHLNSRYKNEDRHTVYVIDFVPRSEFEDYFEGTVWIDSLTAQLLKIELKINNAKTYPFIPMWSDHTLKRVDLAITKTFSGINGNMYVKSIDFNYSLVYSSETDTAFTINTHAILFAYDFSSKFLLPFFDFPNVTNLDYRKIQMLPYNAAFWSCTNDFKMQNELFQSDDFIDNKENIGVEQFFRSDTLFKQNFFENPFITWSTKRIRFRDDSADSSKYNLAQGTIPSQRYHLEAQLFLDINELCDSIELTTKTIFDPYKSYYYFPSTTESQTFINIYFDLMEIERQKMEIELRKNMHDIKKMQQIYDQAKKDAELMGHVYFTEVERGTNKANLSKWNAYVLSILQIDNMAIFNLH